MEPTVTALDDRPGVRVVDPIESAQFELWTASPVKPVSVSPDMFRFPVGNAVEISTSRVVVPELTSIYLHGEDGLAETFDPSDGRLRVEGARTLEINSAPTKLYLRVGCPLVVTREESRVVVRFDGVVDVQVGVRSLHDQPAGTITTPERPEDVMRAVSLLGSALKTTSPERSFPTLRGHPPLIETGDVFAVPDSIEQPGTGIQVEVPPEYKYVYPAVSLAYYLGAEIVPGTHPQLVTENGFTYDLKGGVGYERRVGRVLRQVFVLDCVVRTEGYYQIALHERHRLEERLDVDVGWLYELPLAARLEQYLDVPYDAVADVIPAWPLTVDVDPSVSSLDTMPFLAAELAVVRTTPDRSRSATPTPDVITDFQRTDSNSGSGSEGVSSRFVTPDSVSFDTVGRAWVGDGVPVGVNKLTSGSLHRSLDVDPDPSPIQIHVVCNDPAMQAERTVSEYYQLNERHQFDITVHANVETGELRALLEQDADFLHYIGHVTDDGIVCPDGHLDTEVLSNVSVKAFLLNACDSHEQGRQLVEAGSLGGIITLSDVADTVATRAGTQLARLLAAGHTLHTSTTVLQTHLLSGTNWLTIGNATLSLCHSQSGVPLYLRILEAEDGIFKSEISTFVSPSHGLGSAIKLRIDSETRYLVSGKLDTFDLPAAELDKILEGDIIPVDYDKERYWSDEISAADLI
ncbi:hypothetical protein [Halorussus sp. MSC15.2]|uniref:hypothetical protein n=1 Tax=Halorussus sp. MSC15.2 TaxID=2283638 RepID=UPI0013CFFBC4|nr:hypothetical protein [Halorussus sp. MSC15.2]NEU59235.1 hypothetical protein [Halorussus sp. MSC15.2]